MVVPSYWGKLNQNDMETLKIACYVAGTVMFFASFGLVAGGLANIIKRQLRKEKIK